MLREFWIAHGFHFSLSAFFYTTFFTFCVVQEFNRAYYMYFYKM